ncbi:hypothetical protein AB6A40_002394 [Gnathostoma spinigerum]|uniref:Uncharacterized protein n=1 Tax=Gnathostoma spinigerum TaxID=75299 RepID=A0ABD6E7L8_9BILA
MKFQEFSAYSCFMMVSMTSFLPWNLFMNAHEYFNHKLRNTTADTYNGSILPFEDETALQRSYEGWVTFISGISCLIGSGFNSLTTSRLSNSFRVCLGHLTTVCALLPTFILTFIDSDESQFVFFCITMFLAALASFGSMGLIASGILGLAARFPANCVQAVMLGQAVAGLLCSLLSIFCQALTTNAVLNGRFFFGIAFTWTTISVFVYIVLVRSSSITALMSDDRESYVDQFQQRLLTDQDYWEEEEQYEEGSPDDSLSLRPFEEESFIKDARTIITQAKMELLTGFIVIFITLSAFPALASLVRSTSSNKIWKSYFTSVACFLLFNCGDVFGRVLSAVIGLRRNKLFVFAILRALFVPLLFFSNIRPRHHSRTFIDDDLLFILFMSLFSTTNGFIFSAAGISATRFAF